MVAVWCLDLLRRVALRQLTWQRRVVRDSGEYSGWGLMVEVINGCRELRGQVVGERIYGG